MGYTIFPDGKYGEATEAIYKEYMKAKSKFRKDFNSHHEGFAVLKEEVDELWDDVKCNRKEEAIKEAIQVGAMAIRFVAEFGKYPYDSENPNQPHKQKELVG